MALQAKAYENSRFPGFEILREIFVTNSWGGLPLLPSRK